MGLFAFSGCGADKTAQRETSAESGPGSTTSSQAQTTDSGATTAGIEVPSHFAYEGQGSPDLDPERPRLRGLSRPNILLITLDTTRRDHLSCYGHPRETTPNLDGLARDPETRRFTECVVASPVTLPSHATILTGLEPFQHHVRNNGIHVLDPRFETVPELLSADGYATGAITGAFPVAAQFGLDQGFDHYDDDLGNGVANTPVPQRLAEDVTARGLAWLSDLGGESAGQSAGESGRESGGESGRGSAEAPAQAPARADGAPWFLWLHYFDPHDPYAPPAPFDQAFPDAPYDNEILYTDAHIGGLFRELKRRGLWDDTCIIVTADHGEGLGEHSEPTHSLFVYRTTIDAPLLIKLPRTEEGGGEGGGNGGAATGPADVGGLVASSDIAPTILELASVDDIKKPEAMRGISLLGAARRPGSGASGASGASGGSDSSGGSSGTPVDRRTYAYMETLVPLLDYGWSPYRAIQSADAKLILATEPEFYDLAEDPNEQTNLYDPNAPRVAELLEQLMTWIEDDQANAPVAMDAETIERLQSLGYIAGGGSAAGTGDARPDAKNMLWALAAFDEGRGLLLEPNLDGAAAKFESVLRRDPANRFARRTLTWVLPKTGRADVAADLCRAILKDEPDAADAALIRLRLADALLQGGKPAEAAKAARSLRNERAVALDAQIIEASALAQQGKVGDALSRLDRTEQDFPEALALATARGRILERAERWDEAGKTYEDRLETHGASVDLLTGLAAVRIRQQRADEAIPYLQQALTGDPQHARANFQAGLLEAAQGNGQPAMQHFLRAVRAEPGSIEYQVHLGNHCLFNGLFEKAREHLERAVSLGDARPSTLAGLGFAELETGLTVAGRQHLETALQRGPEPSLRKQIEQRLAGLETAGS